MPNNENNYRIQLEFASFLRGLPEFIIDSTELEEYVDVTIQPLHPHNFLAYFSRSNLQIAHYTPQYLIQQLFQELEKDYVDRDELIDLGRMFKKYWHLLKQIQNDRAYYAITPGMMAGFFIVLHTCLLAFPANKALVYTSLIADFYSLSFWLFSLWSLSKNGQALYELESKLMEKINFLKVLSSSMPQTDEYYLESSSSVSLLPSYQDVLLEDASRERERSSTTVIPANASYFFLVPALNNDCSDSNQNDNTDQRSERCYPV